MSFVKDDHKYTRGVGAIAAMDAVSPARRRAAARGAVAMARRDSVMARHTLGRINNEEQGGGGGGGGGSTPTPPRPPGRPPIGRPPVFPVKPRPIRNDLAILPVKGIVVKDPGTVLPPVVTPPIVTLPPPREPVKPLPGTPWTPPTIGPKPAPPTFDMPQFDSMPDVELTVVEPAPQAAARSSNLLVYAVLGAGALWLLTRNK